MIWVAILALVISGLSLFVSVSMRYRTWKIDRQRVAVGRDPDQTRLALEAARAAFNEAVGAGGKDNVYWREDDRKVIEERLRDNANRVRDAELRTKITRVADTYKEAWSLAPPRQYAVDPSAPFDSQRQQRLDQVAEVSRRGAEECGSALDRLNALEAGTKRAFPT